MVTRNFWYSYGSVNEGTWAGGLRSGYGMYANGIDMKGVKKWPETVIRRVHPLLLFLKVRKPQIPSFKSSGTIVH